MIPGAISEFFLIIVVGIDTSSLADQITQMTKDLTVRFLNSVLVLNSSVWLHQALKELRKIITVS